MPERAPGQQRSDTRGEGARQLLDEERFHRVHQPFADLQRHVPGESIADDDVRLAAVDVARLHVPDEAERRCLEQAVRFARQLVALAFLLADREQPHARRRQAEADAGVDAAHDGELQQVLGPALDAGAHVEQDGGMPACRDGDCERRPIDARQHPEGAVCRDNRRAGVTRAEERSRLPAGDQPGCDGDRRVRLAAQRRRRRIGHRDRLGGVDHLHAGAIDIRMPGNFGLDLAGRPDERHAEIEMPRGRERAVDDVTRREVAAHGVNCDPDHDRVLGAMC